MRPTIPRVRPGDVLRGTRNLRRYLQTAAALTFLKAVSQGIPPRARKDDCAETYVPAKDDEFLVVVNAWGMFCAVNVEKKVSLLFTNPVAQEGPANPRRVLGTRHSLAVHGHGGNGAGARMNPTIFSKWFIRTNKKVVDVTQWPDFAHHIWMALHFNLGSIRHDSAPNVHYSPDAVSAPFYLHRNMRHWKRHQLDQLLLQWIPTGITRNSAEVRTRGGAGNGPRLEDIENMERELRSLCENPRLSSSMKSKDLELYKMVLKENQ